MIRFFLLLLLGAFSPLFSHTKFLDRSIYSQKKVYSIPKIIHQIWVGDAEIPETYLAWMQTWKDFHPDWEYKLWTDKDIDDFPWKNRKAFDAVKNPGMKSDIWRYEIVYNYGGLYVDADMECVRSFDPIHERLEFYAGYDTPCGRCIGNNIFAAKAKSPYLEKLCSALEKDTAKIIKHDGSYDQVQILTGPHFINKVLRPMIKSKKDKRCVVFDASYFQPVNAGNHGTPVSQQEKFYVENTCFCIHYNGCSWCK